MNLIIKTGLLALFCVFLLACDNSDTSDEDYSPEDDYSADSDDELYHDPYMEFCLQGSKLDIDPNTLTDDDCIFRTEGRNRSDMTDPKANAFYASVSDFPALQEAGIDSFGIDIKIGPQAPKVTTGIYTLVPYSVLSTEAKQLPDVMVHLRANDKDSLFAAVMKPDVEKLKLSDFMGPDDYPGYEIVSAILTVTHVEDIPLDEDEKNSQKLQAEMGMLTGQQYVKGTFTFSVKKFGNNGSNFGPETFTFGSRNDWAYFPKHSE
ncbi:hypothetical protein SAMN02745866_01743 [Alteromonadaceae bacterium Bs31]|nr:hypothetical protein SAMN02745866_01743 [Alteromonadaceae bacterium Bs31]